MPFPIRKTRKTKSLHGVKQDRSALIRLWLLRIIVPLGGYHDFINVYGFSSDAVASYLGMGETVDENLDRDDAPLWSGKEDADSVFKVRNALLVLRQLHRQAESDSVKPQLPACLGDNIRKLARLVGLNDTEQKILAFATLIHNERVLDDAADWLGQMSTVKVFAVLSGILDLPEVDIRAALTTTSALATSGLLSIERTGMSTLRSKLNLLSDQFADHILTVETEPIDLLRDTVMRSAPAILTADDYPHIRNHLDVLRPYLKEALRSNRRGVNVLIHGDPGTGKTQLARVLAEDAGSELFEVTSEDGAGDPIAGAQRLRAYRAGQSFFANRSAILLFDEAEDVFNDGEGAYGKRSTAQTRKAWVNRMLEENTVPTIWLSNSACCLDAAFIRRFDVVVELSVPPKKQRQRIITDLAGEMIDARSVSILAESEVLTPAIVARTAAVLSMVGGQLTRQPAEAALTLINSTLEAQGYRSIRKADPARLPEAYDPAFIHADTDLIEVANGLADSGQGRLCLYGPPGTGKTAYGRWLAEKLGRPLLVRRASDLLGMYVGQSEKNIARAFSDAEQDGAVLLIDEVDSFLRDRQNAVRSWEVSEVNEMLTQMESFGGIFIASTNLMDGLDQASLRRFDLKVKFDYLLPAQSLALFARHCEQLALPESDSDIVARVLRLSKLTPGDFAAVMRQHRFRPIRQAHDLFAALELECQIKQGHSNPIGFV